MPDVSESLQSRSENLCIACGLCCSGHLFTHANVGDDEIPAAESLELPLDKFKESGNRHFYLPCPRFTGKCSVYDDPRKPRICTIYKCDLLKALEAQKVTLEQALIEVQETKGMIEAIHAILPEDAGKIFASNCCLTSMPWSGRTSTATQRAIRTWSKPRCCWFSTAGNSESPNYLPTGENC